MLASRLSSDPSLETVVPDDALVTKLSQPVDDSAALSVAAEMKADYVAFGKITITGDSARTDARFIRTSDKTALVVFNQTGKDQGDVLNHIQSFAAEILTSLGLNASIISPPKPQAVQHQQEVEAESRRHPDTLWTGSLAIGSTPIRMMTSDGKTEAQVWKSTKFKTEIRSLAVGDILGDKQNQLVMVQDDTVSLYRYNAGKLELIDEYVPEMDNTPIRVDVGDINQNGRAEIYVTNLYHDKNELRSFVLEWDGSKLANILQNVNWYFRVVTAPKNGSILLGQQRGVDKLFTGGVYQLAWQNGTLVDASMADSPRGLSLYAFTNGEPFNNGKEATASLTSDLRLRVFDQAGDMEWTSVEKFIGGGVYMPLLSDIKEPGPTTVRRLRRFYLPQRIFITDVDGDGKNEVVLLENKDVAWNLFPNLRLFRSGHIDCLQWEEMAFGMKWKTSEVSGQINDMVIGDLNNDGIDEIVYAVVELPGSALNDARSYISSWQIGK